MIAAVAGIAGEVCRKYGLGLQDDPQTRCVWFVGNELHVSARNLDGAIPSLMNPSIVWEIKEYWGKTEGGSKMSDAVYECHLVGMELRQYEERTAHRIQHVVFIDGLQQWSARMADLRRLIDLLNQGLIDHLLVGVEVERQWAQTLDLLIGGPPPAYRLV